MYKKTGWINMEITSIIKTICTEFPNLPTLFTVTVSAVVLYHFLEMLQVEVQHVLSGRLSCQM